MRAVSVRPYSGSARLVLRFLWPALFFVLIFSSVSFARELVLGFVPEKCQLLADERQAELLADYLSRHLDLTIRVRVFTDERNLQHWMNRFREIDLAVFSSAYIKRDGQGRFLPLAEYIDAGTRRHGGGLVVGRRGLSGSDFAGIRRVLLGADRDPAARELLAGLRVVQFVIPRQPKVSEKRSGQRRQSPVQPVSTGTAKPLPGQASVPRAAIRILSPPAGGTTGPRPLLLFETEAEVVRVSLDGKVISSAGGARLGPLSDGRHVLRFSSPQFTQPRQVVFRVDATPPMLTVDLPKHEVSSSQALISGSREEDARLRLLDAQGREAAELSFPDRTHWRATLKGLIEGENRFQVEARDAYGNRLRLPLRIIRKMPMSPPPDTAPGPSSSVPVASAPLTPVVAVSPPGKTGGSARQTAGGGHVPELKLLSPEPRTYATAQPSVDYRLSDPTARLDVEVDGKPVGMVDGRLPPLADGTHRLRLKAVDANGHTAVQEVTFSIDTTAPEFAVQFDPRPLSVKQLTLRGTRDPGAFIDLLAPPGVVVGATRYPVENRWEIDLDKLPEGELPLHFSARDRFGNTSHKDISLHIDRTPPHLEVSSPRPGPGHDPRPPLLVKGEGGPMAVLLNGQPVPADAGQLGPLADGSYILLVREQDLAGNQSQQRVAFQVDTRPPEVVITSPAPGARSSAFPIVDYRVSDGSVRVLLDDKPVEVTPGTALPRLADGPHRLQVVAVDEAGNEGRAEVEFLVDSTAPEVVLLSPASGLTADNTPLLEYEVDRGEVRVLVDDKVVDKRSGMFLDPLSEGEHLVRVEAWDETGNVGFAERRLIVSTARPAPAAEDEIIDDLVEFSVSLTPEVVSHRYDGLLTLKVGPLRRAGTTLYLEQWIDKNGNGVADSGEQIVRVFKLVDGLASPSPRVPGDIDGKADRMITTRFSLDQLHDGSPGPIQYVLLAMGDSHVAETVFRVVPEP
ncbi:hypothetical protein [Geothermobacter hydrogeniphilus]|uniref:Uncharacterized protein n=1 Tax=Geothermobacter hydrogeniphilus TaxID=1969733 RepID=A0A1X0Y311_9BACT|nr:hypothetical protein [Geothermobacter hydrogeniphilus]ORJ59555.1 hypothetical protein B5V00_09735 [Geothermobacter hydrogeniphilus]